MEQMIKAKDVRVRLDKKSGRLFLTVFRVIDDDPMNVGNYTEKFVSMPYNLIYKTHKDGDKVVYDYKVRVDMFETDEGNKNYSVLELNDVINLISDHKFDENKEFSINELVSMEQEIRNYESEIKKHIQEIEKDEAQPGDTE